MGTLICTSYIYKVDFLKLKKALDINKWKFSLPSSILGGMRNQGHFETKMNNFIVYLGLYLIFTFACLETVDSARE